MYRSTITFLLSMLMALLVIPTGSSFAGTGRDKKASTRLSQKKKSGDQNQSTFPQTLGQEQSFQSFAETKDSGSKAKGFPANTVSAFENLALQN